MMSSDFFKDDEITNKYSINNWSNLLPFTETERRQFYNGRRFKSLNPLVRSVYVALRRLTGCYSFEDQITLSSMCEPPMFFLRHGCVIPHPYGITLSADFIGADCYIGQLTTIGTNQRNMRPGEETTGHKPRIGPLCRIYPNATISGEVNVGGACLIAAGAVVTRDVPPLSIVYGVNDIKPLQTHHIGYLLNLFYQSRNNYRLVRGLTFCGGALTLDPSYKDFCGLVECESGDVESFARHLKNYFRVS